MEGSTCAQIWIICFTAEFTAASCVSSFAWGSLGDQISNKHKSAHRETSNRLWAKEWVQTDRKHKLAFTDRPVRMDKHLCVYFHYKKKPNSVEVKILVSICPAVACFLFMLHISLTPMRKEKTPCKLSLCCITSYNLSFLLNQATLHWVPMNANIQLYEDCACATQGANIHHL